MKVKKDEQETIYKKFWHLIASRLLSAYSTNGFEGKIAEFIIKFMTRVSTLSQSANEQASDPYIRYAYLKKFAFLRIQEKYDIMASELLKAIPDMNPKDPHRLFTGTERLAIYLRADGKCAKCGKVIEFKDRDADHIIMHSKGGQTTIRNGRWLCQPCNRGAIHGTKTP
jgi:hypothetical protein